MPIKWKKIVSSTNIYSHMAKGIKIFMLSSDIRNYCSPYGTEILFKDKMANKAKWIVLKICISRTTGPCQSNGLVYWFVMSIFAEFSD